MTKRVSALAAHRSVRLTLVAIWIVISFVSALVINTAYYDKENVEQGDSITYTVYSGSSALPQDITLRVLYSSDNMIIYSQTYEHTYGYFYNGTSVFNGLDYPYYFVRPGLGSGSVFDYTQMLAINYTEFTSAWTNSSRWENSFFGTYLIPLTNWTAHVSVWWDAITGVMLHESIYIESENFLVQYSFKSQNIWGNRQEPTDWRNTLAWTIVFIAFILEFVELVKWVVKRENKEEYRTS